MKMSVILTLAGGLLLSSCAGIDTTPPKYKVRLFETQEEINFKHELRMQSLRDRQRNNLERWRAKHRH